MTETQYPEVRGVVTATVTPFDDRGEVDYDVYARLLDHLIERGVAALCPGGTTGEYFAQSFDERRQIMGFVKERVGDRVQLFAGTNATTTRETVELTRIARDLGYEAALLAAPPISRPTNDELVRHFVEVLDEGGLPIILYNNPPRTGVDLDPALLRRLLQHDGFIALKESSGDLARLHSLVLELGDEIEISCGSDSQAVEYFLWGSKSWIAGPSNVLSGPCVAIYRKCVEEQDIEGGREIMRRILPVMKILEERGKFLQYCKFGVTVAGVPVGATRAPLRQLSAAEQDEFRTVYERCMDEVRELGVQV